MGVNKACEHSVLTPCTILTGGGDPTVVSLYNMECVCVCVCVCVGGGVVYSICVSFLSVGIDGDTS